MRLKKPRIGDIYVNPVMGDLWILREEYDLVTEKFFWEFSLVHSDCQEEAKMVKGFVKVGNIYDMVTKELKNKNKGLNTNKK